jgi:hypothetical protein
MATCLHLVGLYYYYFLHCLSLRLYSTSILQKQENPTSGKKTLSAGVLLLCSLAAGNTKESSGYSLANAGKYGCRLCFWLFRGSKRSSPLLWPYGLPGWGWGYSWSLSKMIILWIFAYCDISTELGKSRPGGKSKSNPRLVLTGQC